MIKTYKCEVDCANCASRIEAKIKELSAIVDADINFMAEKCRLEIKDDVNLDEVLKEIKDIFKKVDDDSEFFCEKEV